MIVIQVRDLLNATCGAPVLCPNEFIARRQVGRIISEHPVLKDHPDKVFLDIIGDWDESRGMKPDPRPSSISGVDCYDEYQKALAPFDKPGEGEFVAEDPFQENLKGVDQCVEAILQ